MFAPLFKKYGMPEALFRYNKPATGNPPVSIKRHYLESWERAKEILREVEPVSEFSFETEGFQNKAAELGPEVVGEPREAEHSLSDEYTVQFTTTGVMVYAKSLNETYFFAEPSQ